MQIYRRTLSLKRANDIPKLPGVDYVVKNWALAMMLKALPLVHFWSALSGADLGGGCRGCAPNTTGILQKKNYVVYWCWQETSAPPPKKILDPPLIIVQRANDDLC